MQAVMWAVGNLTSASTHPLNIALKVNRAVRLGLKNK